MTESISAHSVEQECCSISSSQSSLTQDQRDRIAQQKELAVARRSAKTEALLHSSPAHSSQKDGNRAADLLHKVRSSPFLPPLSKPPSTVSAVNPFRKFARKPFSPPLQIIELKDDSSETCEAARFPHVNDMHESEEHATGEIMHPHEATANFDAVHRGKNDIKGVSSFGARQQEDHDLDSTAGFGNAKKRQWLWLPDTKTTPKSSTYVGAPKVKRVRASREERARRRAIREGSGNGDGGRRVIRMGSGNNDEGRHAIRMGSVNNDDGWISVRKRSLPGHIFGQINSDKGASHVENIVMNAASNINSKIFSTRKPQMKLTLSSQQRNVLLAIAAGKSVFLTGSAGTGKSYLLHEAVYTLKNMYGPNAVFITASTGLAACAIGGTTLHSFAGIGLGMGEKREIASKVNAKREARKRWMDCKALIIDEISMIDGELFDKLEYVACAVRRPAYKNKVFGGIQLVVTGDFFQLPPVHPENPDKYFAFQADCWNDCFQLQVELTQVFRQSDSEFVKMLNELRKGQCSSMTHLKLSSCNRPLQATNMGILMTKLYPRKMDVGRENEQKLRSLNQETVAFLAKDDSKSDFAMRQLENVRAEKELYLCVGAQVMLVKNVDSSAGLVNGSRGVVVRFVSVEELDEGKDLAKKLSPSGLWPVVLFACDGVERLLRPESWSIMDGNTEVAKRSQIPLVLAWALSVHKCQGMTLDRVEIDLSKSFEYGMVYVALSRVKCLDGLRLIGFDPSLIKVHSKVAEFYEELKTGEL